MKCGHGGGLTVMRGRATPLKMKDFVVTFTLTGHRPLRRGDRGIALMMVLWVITLLTIIAIGLSGTQRTEIHLAANQVTNAVFRAQAEAAIQLAALNLLTPVTVPETQGLMAGPGMEDPRLWNPDGQPRLWGLGGETLEIRIYNESSLIDLNMADPGLLLALLMAAGLQDRDPESLVDAILDWRDEDDLHLANGAEDADYAAAGLPYGAKDGPFQSLEELQQVLGFDRDLYRLLSPALTVSTGEASPSNSTYAPPLVQAALEGISVTEVEERRQQNEAVLGKTALSTDRGGPLYRIRVGWATETGAFRAMEALVRVQLGNQPPIQVLERRYALATTASPTVE